MEDSRPSSVPQSFREIAVLGAGLLGGSLALALREKSRVRLWGRRPTFLSEARRLEMASICTVDLREAVEGADLVILCTPIETMAGLVGQMIPFLGAETIITDVGSAKKIVCDQLKPLLGVERFLGSHPMAGSEQSGLQAANANLFQKAVCIITPDPDSPERLVQLLTQFWSKLGCQVVSLTSEEHDSQMGLISHLPHLLAGCLVNAVAAADAPALKLAGQGFRDSTRIASGPPEMWTGILRANRDAVLAALAALREQVKTAEALLHEGNEEGLRNFLTLAKTRRDGIIRK